LRQEGFNLESPIMVRMGTPAPNLNNSRSWERAATRAAILTAARHVAERDGILDLSLTSVAKEAGFAPTSVYAYFTSKNDLLLAVIADDLATMARAMRHGLRYDEPLPEPMALEPAAVPEPPEPEPLPAKPVMPALAVVSVPKARVAPPDPVQPEPAEEPIVTEPEVAESVENLPLFEAPAWETGVPPEPEPVAPEAFTIRIPVVEPRREQTRQTLDDSQGRAAATLAQLQETVTRLEARQVDAWLERRLREFERSLAALEAHQGDRSTADSALEARLRELKQELETLEKRLDPAIETAQKVAAQRLETSERKTREHESDLESQLALLANRVTALENAAYAATPELFHAAAEKPAPADVAPIASVPPEPPKAALSEAPTPVSPESYLMAARKSAQAAAAAVRDEVPERPRRKGITRTTIAIFVGSIVIILLLAGLETFLRARELLSEPVRTLSLPPSAHVVPHHAALPPPVHETSGPPSLVTLASAGNPGAELLVGLAYLDGNGIAKDPAQGAVWLARAADHGQALAQYRLATLYQDGTGVPRDPVVAFRWFGAAAAKGNRKAMHSLAVAYAEGWGTKKDLAAAARWFGRAASEGFVNAQFNLAILDERGLGVPQSLTAAYKWYAIAAGQGDHESQARVEALASQLPAADLAKARKQADSFQPLPVDPSANLLPQINDLVAKR
jgi:TPR repeat protein